MSRGFTGVADGIRAALSAPAWVRGTRFSTLIAPPERLGPPRPRGRAEGAAVRAVGLLARLPGSPWRDTCLYRSTAACLALRARGIPAVVRLGVRRDGGDEGAIAAHAWVEVPGEPSAAARAQAERHAVLGPP